MASLSNRCLFLGHLRAGRQVITTSALLRTTVSRRLQRWYYIHVLSEVPTTYPMLLRAHTSLYTCLAPVHSATSQASRLSFRSSPSTNHPSVDSPSFRPGWPRRESKPNYAFRTQIQRSRRLCKVCTYCETAVGPFGARWAPRDLVNRRTRTSVRRPAVFQRFCVRIFTTSKELNSTLSLIAPKGPGSTVSAAAPSPSTPTLAVYLPAVSHAHRLSLHEVSYLLRVPFLCWETTIAR
ncbi:hypothetical protein C8Q78DRAFT_613990 [Trametes maxima]|nr:hypothetical protein C8Q78DRAFT_613990 [Trametes maxima]